MGNCSFTKTGYKKEVLIEKEDLISMFITCQEENITSFSELFFYAYDNDIYCWLDVLLSFEGAYIVSKFLESRTLEQDSEDN